MCVWMFNVVRFTKHVIYVKIKLLYYKLILRNIFHFHFWAKKKNTILNEPKSNARNIFINWPDQSIHPASQPTNSLRWMKYKFCNLMMPSSPHVTQRNIHEHMKMFDRSRGKSQKNGESDENWMNFKTF